MVLRNTNEKGFTLVEVLLVVAIVLVMLGVALPMIFSSQRNLLLDSENASASAIANAAQAEMTLKKTSGTWASLVREESGDYKSSFPQAKGAGAADKHSRYMTAQTARDLGIITSLGVEDKVRDASYIIEFDGLTATVKRVFFTDGATGFFGAPRTGSSTDQRLLSYYDNVPEVDNPSARLSYMGCAIGLFEGTADGATPAAALVNPSVSANDYGKIVLTNPNLADADNGTGAVTDLVTEVQFAYPIDASTTYTFTISNMTKNYTGDTYTITASDGTNTYTCSLSNAPASGSGIYTVEGNTRFEVDLNDLSAVLEDRKGEADTGKVWDIVKAMQDKSRSEAQSKLQVLCLTSAKDCMSVMGRAFVDWPAKVPTLKVYVTDPDPTHVDTAALNMDASMAKVPAWVNGTYTSPDVMLVDKDMKPVESSVLSSYTGLISESMLKASFSLTNNVWVNGSSGQATKLPVDSTTFNVLLNENVQEGSQTYSGKTIKIETADSIKANVMVTVGSYTSKSGTSMTFSNTNNTITYEGGSRTGGWSEVKWPTGGRAESEIHATGTKHDYQIFEVWLDDGISNHRVGYFQGKEWQWEDDILRSCVKPVDEDGRIMDTITEDTTRLMVDSAALMSKAGELSKYKNYSLYVRTAPRASEALEWFDQHAYTFANYVGWNSNTTDQRGKNHGRPIRWLVAYEFGASTTVAAWTVSTGSDPFVIGGEMKDMRGQYFPMRNTTARIYYSTLPAVGWDIGKLDSRYLDLPNAQLMMYRWSGLNQAFERIALLNGQTSMYSHSVDGQMLQVRATEGADIAITPKYDYMFYRVLVYFDQDGKTRLASTDFNDQYTILPLDGVDSSARFPVAPDMEGMNFIGWKVYDQTGKLVFRVARKSDGTMPSISDCVDQMPYGAVSLVPEYREGCNDKIGLLYLDSYDKGDGAKWHYTGYLSANKDTYADDASIDAGSNSGLSESGYYFVYPVGTGNAPSVDVARSMSSWGGKMTVAQSATAQVNINGTRYALYKVSFDQSCDALNYVTAKIVMADGTENAQFSSTSFYCNSIFGGMVANDVDTAKTFGCTEYPWRVYNAEMFPGVVQSKLQDQDMTKYACTLLKNNNIVTNSTNKYVQMRNLDFQSVNASSLKQWPEAFWGTYDGQNYIIKNAQNGFTRAPYTGNADMSAVGTVSIGTATPNAYAEGLFPALIGQDVTYAAGIKNLYVEVGDFSSDAQMVGLVCAFAKQATFANIHVKGNNGSGAQSHITLRGMVNNPDLFYASAAVAARCEKCFAMKDCSADNFAFDYQNAKFSLANTRNVFGGLAGVLDLSKIAATDVPGASANLSVTNIAFNLDDSCKFVSGSPVSYGGLFGRFYFSGNADFKGSNWVVGNITIDNNSAAVPDTAIYPGIICGSIGGTARVFDGAIAYSNVKYISSASAASRQTLDMCALFNNEKKVAASGLLSGTDWCFVNMKKASEAMKEASKFAGAIASTASVPSTRSVALAASTTSTLSASARSNTQAPMAVSDKPANTNVALGQASTASNTATDAQSEQDKQPASEGEAA